MVGNQRYKCKILCKVPKMQVFTITSYEVSILEITLNILFAAMNKMVT